MVRPGRNTSIALWSALGGGISALGPLIAGFLLEHFWWGSVFLVTLPLAVIALVMAWLFVPAHVNESTEPVDNLGGILSVLLVAGLVLAINFVPVPGKGTLVLGLALIALAAAAAFVWRQRRAAEPALRPAHRAASYVLGRRLRRDHRLRLADGREFVCQQYLQNVLGYNTVEAGAAFLPAVVFMVLVAPRSASWWSPTAPGRPC